LSNAEVAPIRCNKQLFELYEWADIVVVPLKHNLHASGITVIQEAVLRGVPVVCSKVGGLDAYFSGWQVKYVPPGDPAALRQAILDVAADAEQRVSMVRDAQSAMGPDGLSSLSFVRRHVELSVELLAP
jgi:glycosyltransferase involved in cell wall biosynthesis